MLISKINSSKLYRKAVLGLAALTTALSIEMASPSIDYKVNNIYAAEIKGNYIIGKGMGCYKGAIDISGKDAIQKAKKEAIYNAFEDIGAVLRKSEIKIDTKENIRRETGQKTYSMWTQEMIEQFITTYPESYSVKILNNPEKYYTTHNLEACVEIELKISEKEYNDFIQGPERFRELEYKYKEKLYELETTHKEKLNYIEQHDKWIASQERSREADLELGEKQRLIQNADKELQTLDKKIEESTGKIDEMYGEIYKIEKQLSENKNNLEKVRELKSRTEELRRKYSEIVTDYKPEENEYNPIPNLKKPKKEDFSKRGGGEVHGYGTLSGLLAGPTLGVSMAFFLPGSDNFYESTYIYQGLIGGLVTGTLLLVYKATREQEEPQKYDTENPNKYSSDWEVWKEERTKGNMYLMTALGLYATSIFLGIRTDIKAHSHNKKLRNLINYSVNINPLEKQIMLSYKF